MSQWPRRGPIKVEASSAPLPVITPREIRKALEIFRSHPPECFCQGCTDITEHLVTSLRRLSSDSGTEDTKNG